MIARWPGKIPAGRVSNEIAVMMDLFATVLHVTGAKMLHDRTLDGRNILPLFTSDAKSPHEYIFGQQNSKLACVRDASWKLHVLRPGGGLAATLGGGGPVRGAGTGAGRAGGRDLGASAGRPASV
jgi:arylsulfatase A-like enzyme